MLASDQENLRALILLRLTELSEASLRGEEGQSIVQLDQQAIGRLSRMDALQNQAISKASDARRRSATVRLESALARMDEGAYGACEDCGEPIALGRLKLDPAACLCISCASG